MYYFEYDKSGYLIKYIETENKAEYSGVSISDSSFYCEIKDNLVTKFEENGFFKTVSKYSEPIKLTQSFSEGESWVKVLIKKHIIKKEEKTNLDASLYNNLDTSSYKETNYPWITYSIEEAPLENYVKNVNEYAIPTSVISLEGESLSHLNFKVKDSFLDKWNNLVDF
tara:strand:- start:397 stop:900 length:504 start_codon:yes stop_codon:yes gene_type:complete